MNNQQYWEEVRNIAANLVDDAMTQSKNDKDDALELINDSLLHETIDGHQWVIHYRFSLDVIKHSDNADYMADNIGGLEESLKQGLDTLHCHIAFWALYVDVQDNIDDAIEEYLSKLDETV